MKYNTALFIGRFQPFHFGHLYLLKKALSIAEKIIVGIGSASIYDENNPLSYNTREKIIKKVFINEKIQDKLLKIVPLEDFFNDELWLKNIINKVGDFDVVVSNNEWTNDIMEKAGYKVKRFPYYNRNLYEGWRIRKLIKKGKKCEERVPSYIKYQISNIKYIYKKSKIFKNVVIGGTFDHFHKGHKALIKSALKYGKKIIIGITSDKFIKNKFLSRIIEDFKTRKNNVSNFLKKQKALDRAIIVKINDFIGDLDKRKKIEAIIVSKNTYYNALKINDIREKKGLDKLRIIIVNDIFADDGKILCSERIRQGEIDRKGKSFYFSFFNFQKKELKMPETLRKKLREPLGRIFKNTDEVLKFLKTKKPIMTIAVGDIIYYSLIKNKFIADIGIIDYRSRRVPIEKISNIKYQISNINIKNKKEIENKPGTINMQAFDEILSSIKNYLKTKNKQLISVVGEEDLLALPSILFAPLGSLVLYGHWQYGVIGVEVTEIVKNKINKIISQFI